MHTSSFYNLKSLSSIVLLMPCFLRRLRFGERAQSNLERALLAIVVLIVLALIGVFASSLVFEGKAAFEEHLNSENFYGNAIAIP